MCSQCYFNEFIRVGNSLPALLILRQPLKIRINTDFSKFKSVKIMLKSVCYIPSPYVTYITISYKINGYKNVTNITQCFKCNILIQFK